MLLVLSQVGLSCCLLIGVSTGWEAAKTSFHRSLDREISVQRIGKTDILGFSGDPGSDSRTWSGALASALLCIPPLLEILWILW